MANIALRPAVLADAAALGALHVASWRETYTGILPDEMLADLSASARAAMWTEILSKPEKHGCSAVLVVEEDRRLIGFGSCGRQRDESLAAAGFSGEFGAIYVLRSHHRRGIGRLIMAEMSQALASDGHRSASLWVLRENNPARAFYTKLGGVVVGEMVDERARGTLIEDAFGWSDLSSFARRPAAG